MIVFYLRFDSPYSYIRVGRVGDPDHLAQALSRRDVRMAFIKRLSAFSQVRLFFLAVLQCLIFD